MTSTEVKQLLLSNAKQKDACSSQYDRAEQANTPESLLDVIVDNMTWCIQNKALTNEVLLSFGLELLNSKGVYVQQKIGDMKIEKSVFLFSTQADTIEAVAGSKVELVYVENSTINEVRSRENSTIKKYGERNPVKMEVFNMSCIRDMYHNKIYVAKDKFEVVQFEKSNT